MSKFKFAIALVLLAPFHSWGQISMTQHETLGEPTLRDEVLGFSPQIGAIGFVDTAGQRTSRVTAGLGVDLNMATWFGTGSVRDYYIGISTGGFYSHMGSSSSNFFGANSDVATTEGANLILIPIDAKFGYNLSDSLRLSLHGGANGIYRSAANAASMGSGSESRGPLWKIYPNFGMDLEIQAGKHISFIARPDVTITAGSSVLMGTIGATITPSI